MPNASCAETQNSFTVAAPLSITWTVRQIKTCDDFFLVGSCSTKGPGNEVGSRRRICSCEARSRTKIIWTKERENDICVWSPLNAFSERVDFCDRFLLKYTYSSCRFSFEYSRVFFIGLLHLISNSSSLLRTYTRFKVQTRPKKIL